MEDDFGGGGGKNVTVTPQVSSSLLSTESLMDQEHVSSLTARIGSSYHSADTHRILHCQHETLIAGMAFTSRQSNVLHE